MSLTHDNCKNIVAEAWQSQFPGSLAFEVSIKLLVTQLELKKLDKEEFGCIQFKIKNLE